jgi:hypothetical protein
LYANQSYIVSFPDVLDGSFDGGVEGSLVGESAIGEVPRTLFESGFIFDLGLSTFGPSTLHFQNFSVSAFRFYPQGWDKVSSFQNAVGALATLDEAKADWHGRSEVEAIKVQVGKRQKTWRQKKLEKRKRS